MVYTKIFLALFLYIRLLLGVKYNHKHSWYLRVVLSLSLDSRVSHFGSLLITNLFRNLKDLISGIMGYKSGSTFIVMFYTYFFLKKTVASPLSLFAYLKINLKA